VLKGGSQEGPDRIDYIHRRADNADIYFVCNGAKQTKTLLCRFRDAEGRAEIWYPVSSEICSAKAVSRQADHSCILELQLPAIGSAFVVFRRDGHPPKKPAHIFVDTSREKIAIKGTWTVRFQPGRLAPESIEWDELIDWTVSRVPGIKYFSGTAAYSIQFEMPTAAPEDFWLDLGKVCVVGEVSIDGHYLGTAWTYPFCVKVPAKRLSKGSHKLEVKVTNVWNNRLVGDQFLPREQRVTRTNLQGKHTKDSPLVPSGLLGPVTLQPARPPQVFAAEAVQSSLADDGRYNELFSALKALKDHITGTTALDASQIESHKLTIDANNELFGDDDTIIAACFDLVETYDTQIGPLWVTGSPIQSFTRSSTTNDIHWALYNVMQYIMDWTYTNQNISRYEALFDGFKFGSSAHFPGAVDPPADPKVTHTVTGQTLASLTYRLRMPYVRPIFPRRVSMRRRSPNGKEQSVIIRRPGRISRQRSL
jgi:hypothetical protein